MYLSKNVFKILIELICSNKTVTNHDRIPKKYVNKDERSLWF